MRLDNILDGVKAIADMIPWAIIVPIIIIYASIVIKTIVDVRRRLVETLFGIRKKNTIKG